MRENLLIIMQYIDEHVDYSGYIQVGEIEDLFELYSLSQEEKIIVFEKLEQLDVEIIYTDDIFRKKLLKLYTCIDSDRELTYKKIEKWVQEESISNSMQNKVIQGLWDCGYRIILDTHIDTYNSYKLNKVV